MVQLKILDLRILWPTRFSDPKMEAKRLPINVSHKIKRSTLLLAENN